VPELISGGLYTMEEVGVGVDIIGELEYKYYRNIGFGSTSRTTLQPYNGV
jgi:hypothetical protein